MQSVFCHRSVVCISALMLLCIFRFTPVSFGYAFFDEPGEKEVSEFTSELRLMPPNDRDAESWLKRASEAASRKDWKLAADTLMRVIEQHGDRTITLDDGQHFYSAIVAVHRQLAAWPEDGLAAYRLLYDPEAKRLLDQAQARHDLDALRMIARKYPLTTPGPQAIRQLASWLIDGGRPGEAVDLIHQLSALSHDDALAGEDLQKLAIAYVMTQQFGRAEKTLADMRAMAEKPDAKLPEGWSSRIDMIDAYLQKQRSGAVGDRDSAEKTFDASKVNLRDGELSKIQPIMGEDNPWTFNLPGTDRLNSRRVADIIRHRGRPPVWQLAVDGKRLFVTSPGGLVARDLATFDFQWQTFLKMRKRDPELERHRNQMGLFGNPWVDDSVPESNRLDELSTRCLFHEYRGEVSTGLGLVFVIDQEGTPGEHPPTIEGELAIRVSDERTTEPNSLRAYEAETGRAIWAKGRSGPAEDELKYAHFYSTPIIVNDRLVVPYVHRDDMFLAVMRRDGTVDKKVLLGSGKPGMFPTYGTLRPSVQEGVIFVPTGAGLMVALSTYDFSLRWLSTYARVGTVVNGAHNPLASGVPLVSQGDDWLSTPPLVAGGLVIVAPVDCDKLLALDQQDGVERWSFPRDTYRYVVGTDEQNVIVAGTSIIALNLEDGKRRWVYGVQPLLGRPVICGRQLLVPTEEGLIRLNMQTGAVIGQPTKTEEPLGNLYAVDGSLYSLTADRLTKYPDIEQTRRSAVARLADNADDVDAMIRLSWLETLDSHWSEALSYLDRAETVLDHAAPVDGGKPEKSSSQDDVRMHISHQRTLALLRLATQLDAAGRGEALNKAVNGAQRADDRVKAGLALCEFLAEQSNPTAGFDKALSLLTNVGDRAIRLETDLQARADVAIRERLKRFWIDLSEAQRTQVSKSIDDLVAKVIADNQEDLATRLADGLGFAPQGAKLDIYLGMKARRKGEIESAIYYLRRALRRTSDPALSTQALVMLASAYGAPGKDLPRLYQCAEEALDRLAKYSSEPMPAGLPTTDTKGDVGGFIAQMRSELGLQQSEEKSPLPRILTTTSKLDLATDHPVPAGYSDNSCFFWDATQKSDSRTEVVPVRFARQLRGLRCGDISSITLSWANNLEDENEDNQYSELIIRMNPLPAIFTGGVAVLWTGGQYQALGMITGRTMWAPQAGAEQGMALEPSMGQADDIIVLATDANTLVGIPARETSSPTWRRKFSSQSLRGIWPVGDQIIAIDRNATLAYVIDSESGRIRRQYSLLASGTADKDDMEIGLRKNDPDAHAIVVGGVVCRGLKKSVVGRDALTGRILWRRDFDGLIRGLFLLDARHAGVVHGIDQFAVVRVEGGDVLKDVKAEGMVMPPRDAVLDFDAKTGSGRLLLFTVTDAVSAIYTLASYPLSDGERAWQRPLGEFAVVNRRMMRASPNFIAVIQNEVTSGEGARAMGGPPQLDTHIPPRLSFLDKITGERMGPRPYEFDSGRLVAQLRPRFPLITDVIILDREILAVAAEGYYVLADERDVSDADNRKAQP